MGSTMLRAALFMVIIRKIQENPQAPCLALKVNL